jgi:hypothetical protein
MNQILKNFIPLGDTGSICYLLDNSGDFDSKDNALIQSRNKEIKSKKIQKLILLKSLTKKVDYDSISDAITSSGFTLFTYTANLEFKKQVELLESILDVKKEGNVGILFHGISPALIELIVKLLLYIDNNTSIEEVYLYLTNEAPDIVTLNEFKMFQNFLETDSYLITKPDRSEFKKLSPKFTQAIETKSTLSANESTSTTAFTLNLSSLKISTLDEEPLLTEKEAINFNLSSLIETDFKKEESAEEHYQKIKDTAKREVDDSLSLDVDLSEEIEYISSLESLSGPTMDKVSVVNIDTVSMDNFDLPQTHTPTIDYKTKQYLDFDAIIEEEIDQGMISGELDSDFAVDFNDISLEEKKENAFVFDDSAINLDTIETRAKIDLSFPPPLQDLEDLLDEEMELEHEKIGLSEDPVDPSQTFMVKRINDVIQKEVLNEDSKTKIPVSNLTKVETETAEAIKLNTNPTTPKISNPKISSPRFNPITLDD